MTDVHYDVDDAVAVADPHKIPVVFVTEMIGSGALNGVVNLTFSQVLFTPSLNMKTVLQDRVVASRLRMDLHCAAALRDALTLLIEQNTKPADVKAN